MAPKGKRHHWRSAPGTGYRFFGQKMRVKVCFLTKFNVFYMVAFVLGLPLKWLKFGEPMIVVRRVIQEKLCCDGLDD